MLKKILSLIFFTAFVCNVSTAQLASLCYSEKFTTDPNDWILAQGLGFNDYPRPTGNGTCVNDRGIVTAGVGGNLPGSITTREFVSNGSNFLSVTFDLYIFASNLTCASWKDLPCPTLVDIDVIANGTSTTFPNYPMPSVGPGKSPEFYIYFPIGNLLPAGTNYRVKVSFKPKGGTNCNQGGTKYAFDNLKINNTGASSESRTICSDLLPYTWNGLTFTGSGTQTASLSSYLGCDSLATLNLTVKNTSSSTTNLELCGGELPYTWNGLVFTAAGSKTYHTTNAVGCDSAATLNLTVKPAAESITNITICSSELPYVWNGDSYTATGNYKKFFVVGPGCDSVARLNLTVNNVTNSTTNTTICFTELPYEWNGLTFTEAGTQTVTLVNEAGCDSLATLNLSVTNPPVPSLECYQTSTFNPVTCSYDISGEKPAEPTGLECYQTATFNTTTCQWDVTGDKPAEPTGLECYQIATFNTTTCSWDVTGEMPDPPRLQCYATATFNNETCSWDVTGEMPEQPTLACYESATFNEETCQWDVTGTQPEQPTLACYESASFNTTTCSWDVTGTQPEQPALACYESATFNTTTCSWDVTGTQPEQPSLACYESATFNTTSCSWDVTGTQPEQPTLACYESATFNTTTCSWDVTGTQPEQPTLACYESASFNTTTCSWDVTGTQPEQPTLACYESASFNTTTCSWDVTGTQPEQPTLACYESATFNTTTCSWDVTGTQPEQPTLACYESASFNTTTCSWDVTGEKPAQPEIACYQTATFNTTSCEWVVTGEQSRGQEKVTVFSDELPYTWNGGTYFEAGTYEAILKDQNGCDSIATLILLVEEGGPLPVSITRISAKLKDKNSTSIDWSTQSEINLRHYDVERSEDGVRFSKRGVVNAKRAAANNYNLVDNIAGVRSSVVYYRLKAVDNDGTSKYSSVVSVKLNVSSNVQVYPNPFISEINVNISSSVNESAKIRLYTPEGKLVAQQVNQLTIGENKIVLKNLNGLNRQNYILRIERSSGVEVMKVLKSLEK